MVDTPTAMLGAGVVEDGDVLLYYGTTTTVDVCTSPFERFVSDPWALEPWAPYREVAYAVLGPAIRDSAGPDLAALDEAAAQLPAETESEYVLPESLPQASDQPRGAGVARDGRAGADLAEDVGRSPAPGFTTLSGARVGHHRALLEAFGFVARAGLEEAGFAPGGRTYTASGGGAASATWRCIVSDVLGADQIWLPDSDGSLGAAMLAAWATCDAPIFGEGRATWLGAAVSTQPDPARVVLEARRYEVWRGLGRQRRQEVTSRSDEA
jgi:sugar (pentulose or hexulose) kinase